MPPADSTGPIAPSSFYRYYERPLAIVSREFTTHTEQVVAYPSFPRGGPKSWFRGAATVEDALRGAQALRESAPAQAVAILQGLPLGPDDGAGFMYTPLGSPDLSRPGNAPGPAHPPTWKHAVSIGPADQVDVVDAGLVALVRSDGSVARYREGIPIPPETGQRLETIRPSEPSR